LLKEAFLKTIIEHTVKRAFSFFDYRTPYYRKKQPAPELIKDFICYNQGQYTEYNFLASKRHKDIKTELSKKTPEISKITEYYSKLNDYLDHGLENAFQKNFEYILKYFSNRSRFEPRVCVKAHNKDGDIIDLFRDRRSYHGKPYPLKNNSGFEEVYHTGKQYICNNLPEYAKDDNYVTPRLNENAIKNYQCNLFKKIAINKFNMEDKNWVNCWNPIELKNRQTRKPLAETCYKSTMIIPMTLLGNTLSLEFKQHFEINNESERAIWGYLCFDHRHINYFDKSIDVKYGYVFADIMSLYLIARLNYTRFSKSYDTAKQNLST